MELPSLGENCCVSGCHRLDFLPFRCQCGKIFCRSHFAQHSEICEVLKKSRTVQDAKGSKSSYNCNFEDCSDISLFNFPCKKCGLHYCISHRHHKACDISEEELDQERKRWNLPFEQYNKAKEKIDAQLNKTAMKMAPDSKKSKMSNKIQLMRLKGKAVGQKDIPTPDRLYFLVYKPLGMEPKQVAENLNSNSQLSNSKNIQKMESVAVYVSKNWSIGKVTDSISQLCKVINNNNKLNENKLRLFRALDGSLVSSIMSMKINDILEANTIRDGESLILEYIDSDKCVMTECYLQQYAVYSE